jgi:hypothetical protein
MTAEKTPTMHERIEYFRMQDRKYGIIPLIGAEKHFISEEKFKNCAAIRSVIAEIKLAHPKLQFHEVSPENSLEKLQTMYKEEFWDLNQSGKTAEKNFIYYVEEIIKNAPFED